MSAANLVHCLLSLRISSRLSGGETKITQGRKGVRLMARIDYHTEVKGVAKMTLDCSYHIPKTIWFDSRDHGICYCQVCINFTNGAIKGILRCRNKGKNTMRNDINTSSHQVEEQVRTPCQP